MQYDPDLPEGAFVQPLGINVPPYEGPIPPYYASDPRTRANDPLQGPRGAGAGRHLDPLTAVVNLYLTAWLWWLL